MEKYGLKICPRTGLPLAQMVDLDIVLTAAPDVSWYTFYTVYSDVAFAPQYLAFSSNDRQQFSIDVMRKLVNFGAEGLLEADALLNSPDWKSQTIRIKAGRTLLLMYMNKLGVQVVMPDPVRPWEFM